MFYLTQKLCCLDPVALAAAISNDANCSWLHQSHHSEYWQKSNNFWKWSAPCVVMSVSFCSFPRMLDIHHDVVSSPVLVHGPGRTFPLPYGPSCYHSPGHSMGYILVRHNSVHSSDCLAVLIKSIAWDTLVKALLVKGHADPVWLLSAGFSVIQGLFWCADARPFVGSCLAQNPHSSWGNTKSLLTLIQTVHGHG